MHIMRHQSLHLTLRLNLVEAGCRPTCKGKNLLHSSNRMSNHCTMALGRTARGNMRGIHFPYRVNDDGGGGYFD